MSEPSPDKLETELQRILSIDDEVDRAHAYEALLAEAIAMVERKALDPAIPIFNALAALDGDDDLLQVVQSSAIEHLEALGQRAPTPIAVIEAALQEEFAFLDEGKRHLAIATSLQSYQYQRRDALMLALEYLRKSGACLVDRKARALEAQILAALSRPIGAENLLRKSPE
jgi:hypothetical protein